MSHLVEEFITSLVYFPHEYTIQGGVGSSACWATAVTLTGSVLGMSPAQGHRAPAQRGLLTPLLEERNGRQS